jgi:hypothetical protein
MKKPKLYVAAFDLHWPKPHKPTVNAMLDFVRKNNIDGFIFGGDVFDNDHVSHHNKGKISIEASGTIAKDTKTFDDGLFTELNQILPKSCRKIWMDGNHDDWLNQYLEQHPQMAGSIERQNTLHLKSRGWEYFPCGSIVRIGRLCFIHGETLGGKYHAQTAVDRYCTNVAYGHFHTMQSAVKILPHNAEQRWVAQSFPAMCGLNPTYLRNKPTAWVNGFGIFEFYDGGFFNMWPVVVTRGRFTFGGRVYKS